MNSHGEIIAYLMAAILTVLAFYFAFKRKYPHSIVALILGFVAFFLGECFGSGALLFWGSFTFEQIYCWALGGSFFVFSGFLLKKDRVGYAFAAFLISAFTCFCGLSGVQAFLKTHMLWEVTNSLKSYGEKLDNFQTTIADMNERLSKQQDVLNSNQSELQKVQAKIRTAQAEVSAHQFEITNQVQTLVAMQTNLINTQTNLEAQELKLGNIEYWVQNLFQNITNETFTISDTNHVLFWPPDKFFIRLSRMPIPGSVESFGGSDFGDRRLEFHFGSYNVAASVFLGGTNNWGSTKLYFRYVIDTRNTNYFDRMPIVDKELHILGNIWSVTRQ